VLKTLGEHGDALVEFLALEIAVAIRAAHQVEQRILAPLCADTSAAIC